MTGMALRVANPLCEFCGSSKEAFEKRKKQEASSEVMSDLLNELNIETHPLTEESDDDEFLGL